MRKTKLSVLLVFALLFAKALNAQPAEALHKYQFRGAWVATVSNIDWPLDRKASSGEQIAQLVEEMQRLKDAGINAVFFQIRTECDALYDSKLEPWSYYLTGTQGKAPYPYYDPLEYAVAEAHRLGMELHAWFNPYRASRPNGGYKAAMNHVTNTHPEWLLDFKGYKMLNPALPEVKRFVLEIVSDVLHRYDVDGIHFDDYFYPYEPKISNEDSLDFIKYKGSFQNIDDWRRNNINSLMASIYDSVKAIKPYVKFGISPFGIVENKYAGTSGFNSYDVLYCDPLTWLKDKTVDYITPQLYWEIGHTKADYARLLPWWSSVSKDRHLYIGLFSGKFAARDYKGGTSTVIYDQMKMNNSDKGVLGEVFFSSKSISKNFSGLADSLKNKYYRLPALTPPMPWKGTAAPAKPEGLSVLRDSLGAVIKWEDPNSDTKPYRYVVYRFRQGSVPDFSNPENILFISPENTIHQYRDSNASDGVYFYAVSSLDRLNNESPAAVEAQMNVGTQMKK